MAAPDPQIRETYLSDIQELEVGEGWSGISVRMDVYVLDAAHPENGVRELELRLSTMGPPTSDSSQTMRQVRASASGQGCGPFRAYLDLHRRPSQQQNTRIYSILESACGAPQHLLYLSPLPHGHISFLPIFLLPVCSL